MAAITYREDAGANTSQNPFKFYHYDPTVAGAVIFLLLFLASTLYHSWQIFRSRCWFAIPLVLGGLFEVIGYGGRSASGRESPDWTLGPYIIQSILLLVAPAMFAATIYMELGRIIRIIDGESRAFIRTKWMTKIFVIGDVLSFVLQGGGGGYQSSGSVEALETGAKIIVGGLFVQLFFFGFFIITAVSFNIAINRLPTEASRSRIPWKRHLTGLYITSVLIMMRSVFRTIEYLQGFDGYILGHEAFLYVFDAVPMLAVMVLLNYIHPGEIATLVRIKASSAGLQMQNGASQHWQLNVEA